METEPIEVIATTISGSIGDWGKVGKIVPLFEELGRDSVSLHVEDSHAGARKTAARLVKKGARTIISAGGSGTFNAVLEGCIDSGIGLSSITLGFLRKGSADLIGKTLNMPDDIVEAIEVFDRSIAQKHTVPCDVIQATCGTAGSVPRHLVGYGGAAIFGRIPYYTENRLTKYYKGILSQLFGDLGPFFTGASLASLESVAKRWFGGKRGWRIAVDGTGLDEGFYQSLIIVNGDLGPDLPFAKGVPLGSGDFHMFAIRDLGILKLPKQYTKAFDSSIMDEPDKWGFAAYAVKESLRIESDGAAFPVNIDGSTMMSNGWAEFKIVDRINLIEGERKV
jgi:diacylglycerol kinase family enzyme